MSNRRLIFSVICMLAVAFVLAGCFNGKNYGNFQSSSNSSYLTVKDSAGRSVSLAHKPKRIVLLSTSFVDLLYSVDGKAVGRPSSKTSSIPQEAINVADVGFVYNVNIEKVTALQPDLVVGVQGMHEKLVPLMESSNIPIIILRYKTLEDTIQTIKLMGSIAGTQKKADQIVEDMQNRINSIVNTIPSDKKIKVAILHATAKSVTVELDTTIAGSIAKKLGLMNVALSGGPVNADNDALPYSMEKLVESDPDIIFVVTMGDKDEIEKRMYADVKSNPAWASLRAVKQQKVYFLPPELFLLNPGLKMPEAVYYMAKIAYPEVYKSEK